MSRKKEEGKIQNKKKKRGKQKRMASRRSGRPKILDIRKFLKNRKKLGRRSQEKEKMWISKKGKEV